MSLQGDGTEYSALMGLLDDGMVLTRPSLMWMGFAINKDEILSGCRSIQHAATMMLLQAGAWPRPSHGPRVETGPRVEIGPWNLDWAMGLIWAGTVQQH